MVPGPIVGHVGDGNFHCFFPVAPDDKETFEKANQIAHKIAL